MTKLPDKSAVREALRAALASTLAMLAHAAKDAAEGATHEENRSEGDKDMRATEQSYIARGQAMRAEEIAEEIARLDATPVRAFRDDEAIAAGALVRVSIDGEDERVLYVVPWGGGTELDVGGTRVTVITPVSPVGRALCGRSAGDDFELTQRGAVREWVIEDVR
ncbi:GreA/GreB family elongation factor [Sandaracinus amylolyticus]|nr:GreA/GreB family elongation factor [Sandaracinus amylolyticus]